MSIDPSRARYSKFCVGELEFPELPALTTDPSFTCLRGDFRFVD
jgi:hypothetical protein